MLNMQFLFRGYNFDYETGAARFRYGFDDGESFEEVVEFARGEGNRKIDRDLLDRALFLAFVLIGTSYYKTRAGREVELSRPLDEWQAKFFNQVYQEGLGQFAYENKLTREDLAQFWGAEETGSRNDWGGVGYDGKGILALQSGGKDSLLVASLLEKKEIEYTPWFVSAGDHHPKVLDDLGEDLVVARRLIDRDGLKKAAEDGALNGHVPITYILMSLAVVQAILLGLDTVLVSVGHEAAEPSTWIGSLAVNHQWSKSWEAEQDFAEYVQRYISPDIRVGSPVRGLSELAISEMFVKHAWERFGRKFSSCNVANYRQHADNSELKWCGNCAKCANSYLVFAPFVEGGELRGLFEGRELFEKESLEYDFKGLLGVDGVIKPFECVGEVDELRRAYGISQARGGYGKLPFAVPESSFDFWHEYEMQDWAKTILSGVWS
jgi:hypothetical protein